MTAELPFRWNELTNLPLDQMQDIAIDGPLCVASLSTTGNVTITCSITTAYIAGTDADKATMTLATRGVATVLFLSGTVCVVNGNVS